MTVKEAAALYGVSTQAIYQRLAKAGKKAKDVTTGKNADLTEEGEAFLSECFAIDARGTAPTVEKVCNRCKELESEIAALKQINKALQAQIETAEADKEHLRALLAQEQQLASQAQQLQALTLARLPGEKASIWQKVKNRITGKSGG